jgi:hypothetical protein
MRAFAKVTAIIFILVGVGVVLLGVFFMARGVLGVRPVVPSLFGGPDLSGLLLAARIFAGGMFSLQGMMLAAVGQGLWLLAEIAGNTAAK